ncbi:MAG TPA: hypothetical protein VNM91_11625 [Dehalococcoidia bacterium]|nr:hypothetical protein [Dehalococcoidia bacterium]
MTERSRIPLLSEADLHRVRLDMLRDLTGHDPPPAPVPPPSDNAPQPPRAATADVIALALAAR